MGKISPLILFLFVISMLMAACDQRQAYTDLESTSDQEAVEGLPNLLVQAKGSVQIRREGWKDFLPVGFGALIVPGDLLRVSDGSLVSVFCGSDSTWDESLIELSADGLEHGVPCRSGRPPRPWSDVAAARGENESDIPFVITPRNSALGSDRPFLRWNDIGVSSYTISIMGEDLQNRAPIEVSESEIPWPGEWPPLEPGANYVLIVDGEDIKSNDGNEGNIGLGFWLLPDEESQRIQSLEEIIRSQNMSVEGTDLLIAELYQNNNMRAEAAQRLQSAISVQPSAAMWLKYGRLQLEIGLPGEAIQAFNQALNAAKADGQLEVEAASLIGLGLANRILGDESAVGELFNGAAEIFQQIGDQKGFTQANELLTK